MVLLHSMAHSFGEEGRASGVFTAIKVKHAWLIANFFKAISHSRISGSGTNQAIEGYRRVMMAQARKSG